MNFLNYFKLYVHILIHYCQNKILKLFIYIIVFNFEKQNVY